MILAVEHVTTYRYDPPIRGAVQSLRMFPSCHEGQTTLDWTVEVEDGLRGGRFTDGAGDVVEGWSLRGPAALVTIRAAGRVETRDTAGVLRGLREVLPPGSWLRETPPTRADAALVALAQEVAAEGTDPLDTAHRLAARIAAAIRWRPGVTHAHTTGAEALAQGEGVCQDHAHALIAAARHLGLPARYVSGYMLTGEGPDPTQDGEAAHAWAEIHVRGLGWVGFDAANACCPDARYIRLGSGLDAHHAAPVRGTALGGGAEFLEVAVAVSQAQQ